MEDQIVQTILAMEPPALRELAKRLKDARKECGDHQRREFYRKLTDTLLTRARHVEHEARMSFAAQREALDGNS